MGNMTAGRPGGPCAVAAADAAARGAGPGEAEAGPGFAKGAAKPARKQFVSRDVRMAKASARAQARMKGS